VLRIFALCYEVSEEKNWSRSNRVGRRMPRGGIKKRGTERAVCSGFCPVLRGGCDRKAERACV